MFAGWPSEPALLSMAEHGGDTVEPLAGPDHEWPLGADYAGSQSIRSGIAWSPSPKLALVSPS